MGNDGNMNKTLMKIVVMILLMAIGGLSGCKKVETIYEADVLGTWEIKAWNWNKPQYYSNYDMLGTLEFIAHTFDGRPYYRVRFTFERDGLPQSMEGDVNLANLPIIKFDSYFGSGFPDNLAFRGIVEDDGMIGSGGFFWDMEFYDDWEWEAVKK